MWILLIEGAHRRFPSLLQVSLTLPMASVDREHKLPSETILLKIRGTRTCGFLAFSSRMNFLFLGTLNYALSPAWLGFRSEWEIDAASDCRDADVCCSSSRGVETLRSRVSVVARAIFLRHSNSIDCLIS